MLLSLMILFLVASIITLIFFNTKNVQQMRSFSLFSASVTLILACLILDSFDPNIYNYQHKFTYTIGSEILNLSYTFGLDSLSIYFLVLSSFLVFLCILFIWDNKYFKEYAISLLIINLFLIIVFSVLNLFLFYIFFEAILIPMYFLIGVWGSRERKIRAVYLFFFYTLCGSILFLIGIIYIYSIVGSLDFEILMKHEFSNLEQKILWLCFFLSFASKIPMFPFHIWLPEAHVEAPTVGSVLLAGILLKLGVYGFLRFNIFLFPEASLFYSPFMFALSIIGVLYASITAIRQTDLKRIIAYSSVAHMNLVTIGIFTFNILGIEGSILQSISHGFVSGGMFLLIGILYDRYHSRFLYYYGGLVQMMPLYAIFFLIFTFANIAIPGTSSFVGEFLLLAGAFKINFITCFLSALGVILGGAYSLWLYNRTMFGNLKVDYTLKFADLNSKEFLVMIILFLFIFIMGIYPSLFSVFLHYFSSNISLFLI